MSAEFARGAVEQGWQVPFEFNASMLWRIRCLAHSHVDARLHGHDDVSLDAQTHICSEDNASV